MNDPLLLEPRPAALCTAKLASFAALCRRAGLPLVSVSDGLAGKFLRAQPDYGPADTLTLYDLVWCVRGSLKGLMPCVRTSTAAGEVFHVEFWSLAAHGEPILQSVTATVSTTARDEQRLHLSLPEEQP